LHRDLTLGSRGVWPRHRERDIRVYHSGLCEATLPPSLVLNDFLNPMSPAHAPAKALAHSADTALVAIGRNEGERLKRCLASAQGHYRHIIYVDSASTDGSLEAARALGADCVALDMSTAFTAARARNAGWQRALSLQPDLVYVQFIDGDCEVLPEWPAEGHRFMASHPQVGALAGHVRERHPERSIYNLMCDTEWRRPAGEATAVGGIALVRVEALRAVEGFDAGMIAGEEPEMCLRMRRKGWMIWQLDAPMTLHDAAMLRFGQWWTRAIRTGYAFSLGAAMHGRAPERFWVQEQRRGALWGLVLPGLALLLGALVSPFAGLALAALYPLQWARLYLRERGRLPKAGLQTLFVVLGKLAEGLGQLKFRWQRLSGAQARLIEYK
jgi:GT2 family glycosyltransferase